MKRNKKRNAPRNKKRWNQGTKRIKGLRKEKIRKRKQGKNNDRAELPRFPYLSPQEIK